jgi:RNA polymerase sigma-70 factor (ECF subfamily)
VEEPGVTADEDLLVSQAKAGSQEAFEALVVRYERQIYAFTYRMMGNPDDAFDLTQECFIRAYKNLGRTNAELNVSAWLHRIASNACLDVLRRRKRIRWLPWDAGKHEPMLGSHPGDDPERVALAGENTSDVQLVLGAMSPRNRQALILREYEGMSTQEIGEVMGLSRSAVKSVLFRAREEFRQVYAQTIGLPPV